MSENQTVICRCEEITLKEIKETVERFQCSSREVKLRTRAGMGPCWGTYFSRYDRSISRAIGWTIGF